MISKEKIMNGTIKIIKKATDIIINFFSNLLKLLRKVIKLVEKKLKQAIMGSSIYMKKIEDKIYEQRIKNYSLNEVGRWKETIVTAKQNEEEIPEEYRHYNVMDEEFDMTDELEMKLA